MPRLDEELLDLARRFNEAGIQYAVCGALALGLHGHPRATKDIDFIVTPTSLFEAQRVVKAAGFNVPTAPMRFGGGAAHVMRWSKFSPDEDQPLTVDLLVFRGDHAAHIETEIIPMAGVPVSVVTRDTLVYLKTTVSERPQDHVDIQRLLNNDVED
jgi:hypothetical protein